MRPIQSPLDHVQKEDLHAFRTQIDQLASALEVTESAVDRWRECETKMRKVEHESRGLRKRLAEANTELASVRKSQQDLHDKLDENAKRLESATTKGKRSRFTTAQLLLRSLSAGRPADFVRCPSPVCLFLFCSQEPVLLVPSWTTQL